MDVAGHQSPPRDDLEGVAQLIAGATAPGLLTAPEIDESVDPIQTSGDSAHTNDESAGPLVTHVDPPVPDDSAGLVRLAVNDTRTTTEVTDPASMAAEAASAEVWQRLELFGAGLDALQRLFEAKILRSETESEINSKLHAELQTYKQDLYAKLLKPILADIITAREHVLKVSAHRRQLGEDVIDLDTFESFAEDLAQVLQDNEVEIDRDQPGAIFSSERHQVVGRLETEDPAADRTLATAIGDAYRFQGRPLSRQKVTVYAYRPSSSGDPE